MRVLIAEDDPNSLAFLTKGLAENGFVVDAAANGAAAWQSLRETAYDLIVLDVMMPGMDGWTVLAKLRDAGIETPVLFLTARDAIADRVKGLDLGADDYLVKPFAWPEFLARVRTLLRRKAGSGPDILRVADLELDLVRIKATRGRRPLDLTTKEFLMLTLLVRHQGEIVSRAMLAKQVWGMNFMVDSNAIDVAVGRLRKKLDESSAHKLLHTIRGAGYTLEARDHA
ncbi:MAG: heavy metal response regulator transcription factor [Akkermansiaceae bacterium]|jgi:two-component system copper resistance phosphate regulon response regulator CusR|nr:heavy metal response regulator transcription factor [Akkermansiaceae bacterium]